MRPTLPSPPPAELPGIGTLLGPYRLVDRIGAGGMGEVFLAEHQQLGRKVAVKFLRPEYARRPDLVRRFFQEARVVNQIDHENIVQIFDFVEGPLDLCYLVMEFLVGGDLAKLREEGPFAVGRAVAVASQVADALGASHRRKVIHRDLKPENVFIVRRPGRGEVVKLLDFGLAKLSESMAGEGAMSQPGLVVGTPDFMAPEQAAGKTVDGRADIYALGLLLYWMLCDDVPHRGGTPTETLIQRATRPPPPCPERTSSGELVPAPLGELIDRCLAREPADRPAKMEEVARVLAELAGSVSARPRARRLPWAVAGLVAAAALAVVAASRWRPVRSGAPIPAGSPSGAAVPAVRAPASAPPPRVSPPAAVGALPAFQATAPLQVVPAPKPKPKPSRAAASARPRRRAVHAPQPLRGPSASPDAPNPDALLLPQ